MSARAGEALHAVPCFGSAMRCFGSPAQSEVTSVDERPNHLSIYLMFSGIPNG